MLCLSIQELQCDVSVEEDSRQEWTFTLYDFDNNGKVTREVRARLATSSYSGSTPALPLLPRAGTRLSLLGVRLGPDKEFFCLILLLLDQ